MILNSTKIYQKMKNKSLLSIEKNGYKMRNSLYYDYKILLF